MIIHLTIYVGGLIVLVISTSFRIDVLKHLHHSHSFQSIVFNLNVVLCVYVCVCVLYVCVV